MNVGLSSVDFAVRPVDEGRSGIVEVVPLVDGRSLVELVREHEAARGYDPAGGYGGLVPSSYRFGDLRRYYLAQQEPGVDGSVALLGCDCGEHGCWPLDARVVADADRVTWSDFTQPHRPGWDYDGFGPFAFDRRAYEAATEQLVARLARG